MIQTGESFCIESENIPTLIKNNPRSYWLKDQEIEEGKIYYFDRSSLYREDWYLKLVDDNFLENYEIKNAAKKLEEINGESDEILEALRLLEEVEDC